MKKFLTGILVLTLVVASCWSVFAAEEYTDIDGHWAKKSIERLSDEEIVNGYVDNTYKPDDNITRAEFVTMLDRLFEPAERADLSKYSDVVKGAWYYDAMARAVAMGSIQGDGVTLRPNDFITRQEAVTILNRILNYKPANNESGEKFVDEARIATWAESSVEAFKEMGILNGYEDGSIRPEGNITRAESSKIIDKSVGKIIKTAGSYDLKDVEGCVIVKAEGVTLTNADDNKIIATTDKVKDTITAEDVNKDEIIAIEELVDNNADNFVPDNGTTTDTKSGETATDNKTTSGETTKPSTSGGSSGSSSSGRSTSTEVAIIKITTGENDYTITKSGKVKDGGKITIEVDGKTTAINAMDLKESNFATIKAGLIEIIKGLDEEKVINTVQNKYNSNEFLRGWAKATLASMNLTSEEQSLLEALRADGKFTFVDVYSVIKGEDVTASAIAESVIGSYTYADAISALGQI